MKSIVLTAWSKKYKNQMSFYGFYDFVSPNIDTAHASK
jgi:hypothetical protein